MARISSYQEDLSVDLEDFLIGSDSTGKITKNYPIREIIELANAGPGDAYVQTDGTNQTVEGIKDFLGSLRFKGEEVLTSADLPTIDGDIRQWVIDNFLGINDTAQDSFKLGGELPEYYLNWSNLTNVPGDFVFVGDNVSLLVNDAGYITLDDLSDNGVGGDLDTVAKRGNTTTEELYADNFISSKITDSYNVEGINAQWVYDNFIPIGGPIEWDWINVPADLFIETDTLDTVTTRGNNTDNELFGDNFISSKVTDVYAVEGVNTQWVNDNFVQKGEDISWGVLTDIPSEIMMEGENISLLFNDAGYISEESDTLNTVAQRGQLHIHLCNRRVQHLCSNSAMGGG